MASMEKAAVAWSIGIVAVFIGLAAAGDSIQSTSAPIVIPPAPPAVIEQPSVEEDVMTDEKMEEDVMTDDTLLKEILKEMVEEMTHEMMEDVTDGASVEMLAVIEEMTQEMMEDVTDETMDEMMDEIAATMEEMAQDAAESMEDETMTENTAGSTEPQTVTVEIPVDTALPGCEITDACYIPGSVTINVGDTVAWNNVDIAAHTVTSGSPQTGPNGIFDSILILSGEVFEVTFDEAGSYEYFCLVHPWKLGTVGVS